MLVVAFYQEKALVGAFSVIANLCVDLRFKLYPAPPHLGGDGEISCLKTETEILKTVWAGGDTLLSLAMAGVRKKEVADIYKYEYTSNCFQFFKGTPVSAIRDIALPHLTYCSTLIIIYCMHIT